MLGPARPLAVLLPLLLAVASLASCGDDPAATPGPLRVRLNVLSVDGALPSGLVAQAIDRPDATTTYPLVPAPDGEDGEFLVPGAPEGVYRIEGPGGWLSLHAGRAPPRLASGEPPPLLQLGHPHTVYLLPAASNMRASSRWSAWRTSPEGGDPTPIPVEVLTEPPGYITALRLPAEAWHGDLEIVGELLLAVPGNEEAEAARGPLAQPILFAARPEMHPVVVALQAAPTAPLALTLVPGGTGPRPDGTPVKIEVEGLPMAWVEASEVLAGTVLASRVPSVDKPLAVWIGRDARPLRITAHRWRRSPHVYALDFEDTSTHAVRLTLPEGVGVDQAVARPRGGTTFGMVPLEAEGRAATLFLPPDVEEVFLAAGDAWAHLDAPALGSGAVSPRFEKGFTYQGTVSGDVEGASVRLARLVGDEAHGGQAFEIPVGGQGVFEGHFPLGRYRVEVASPRGVRTRERPLVVDEPQLFHVRLDAP